MYAVSMVVSSVAATFEKIGLGTDGAIIQDISERATDYIEQVREQKERRKNLN